MRTSRARRTLLAGLAAGSLAASVGAIPAVAAPAAPASPAAPAPLVGGPFRADADASLLTVDVPALSPAVLPQTNVDVGRTIARANSAADLDGAKAGNQRTAAFAGTTGTTSLLGAPISIQDVTASAPASESNGDTLIDLPLAPLLDVQAITSEAAANWQSDTECVTSSTPLSIARQEAADATVVEPADGQSLIDLTAGEDGAVDVEAQTGLPATGGQLDQRAVAANVNVNITGVDVLNSLAPGLLSVLEVDVINAPNYTVVATGIPGGAQVLGDDPIVAVTLGGTEIITLEAGDIEQETLLGLTLGDLLGGLDPLLAPLQPVIRLSIPVDKATSADGTTASVSASLLRVEILGPNLEGVLEPVATIIRELLAALGLDIINQPLGVIELAPMSASVVAPAGGLTCGGDDDNPLEVQKTPSSDPAIRGSAFDYTIAIGNTGDCTLTDVVVRDTVTGPAGFDIVSIEPQGTESPEGTVTWNLPDIPPDARVTLRLRITIPANAPAGARFADHVESTANCGDEPVENEDDYDGPGVTNPTSDECDLRGSNKSATHLEVYQGEQFAYFVNVFNSGAKPCNDTDIVDTLDSRLTFVSCSDGCTQDGQRLTWSDLDLQPGQSVTLRVVVQVNANATGELANTAQIDSPSDGDGPKDVTVRGPNITGRSVLADPDPAGPPGQRSLSRTGAESQILLALAVGLGALALVRTRRHALT